MFYLSETTGVEFALTREEGQLVLRSGSYGHLRLPRAAELIAHTHPGGSRLPSATDLRRLNRWWQTRRRPCPFLRHHLGIWASSRDETRPDRSALAAAR
jgi:hypothetical protein